MRDAVRKCEVVCNGAYGILCPSFAGAPESTTNTKEPDPVGLGGTSGGVTLKVLGVVLVVVAPRVFKVGYLIGVFNMSSPDIVRTVAGS